MLITKITSKISSPHLVHLALESRVLHVRVDVFIVLSRSGLLLMLVNLALRIHCRLSHWLYQLPVHIRLLQTRLTHHFMRFLVKMVLVRTLVFCLIILPFVSLYRRLIAPIDFSHIPWQDTLRIQSQVNIRVQPLALVKLTYFLLKSPFSIFRNQRLKCW